MKIKKLLWPVLFIFMAAAVMAQQNIALTLQKDNVTTTEYVRVTFNKPLPPLEDEEQYWITIAPAGTPDSHWGEYRYVNAGTSQVRLGPVRKAGNYEVRLHDSYPRMDFHIVHKLPLTVTK